MKTWQAVTAALIISGLFEHRTLGQTSVVNQLDPLDSNSSGLRVYSLSVSSSYFSQYYPGLFGTTSGYPLPTLGGASPMLQASASVGWSKFAEQSSYSIMYSPSYVRGFQARDFHSLNQSLVATVTRKLNPKLMLAISFQGLVTDFSQLLFGPTLYGNVAGTAADLNDLASGILTGQSANPGLAQILERAPVNGAPETAFLYGGRELNASGSLSLSYAASTRSSFHVSMQAMRTQFVNTGNSGTNIGPAAFIPATTMASANLGWSYSLSPRTTASVTLSSSRSVSRLEDGYSTQGTVSIGRTINTHWFVQGMAGMGYFMPLRETFSTPNSTEPLIGIIVGYKFKAQTLLGSYTRSTADSYGLGAAATASSNGAWTWNRPGSSISLSSGFGSSRLTGQGFPNTTSWTANAGFAKRLQSQLSVSAIYSYARYPERVSLLAPNLALSGVMVGLNWSPLMRR